MSSYSRKCLPPLPVLYLLMYLDFDHRPNIGPVCNGNIVAYAEQNDSAKDQNAIIHGHCSSWRCWGPETEEDDDDHVHAGYDIYHNAQKPRESERPPVQSHLPYRVLTGPTDTASAAAPKKKGAANEVGRVKCTDCQRDDVVKSNG